MEFDWILASDRLPESGVPVLAYYKNAYGMGRRVLAVYAAAKSLEAGINSDFFMYDEETDKYWCAEGWYRILEHEETHWMLDEPATHWGPLPPPPETI